MRVIPIGQKAYSFLIRGFHSWYFVYHRVSDLILCLVRPQVLSQRVTFLYSSIVDFRDHVKAGGPDAVTVDILASSVGLSCNVDPALVNALRMERESKTPWTSSRENFK